MDRRPEPPVVLPRVLGPFDACMVVVGSVIGTGIFLKPGTAAAELPFFGMIISVWVVVGLVTLCGCLALAELGAMLPQAGGPYVYLREAYGRLPAFLWGWTEFWIVRTGSIGALATGTAIYANKLSDDRLSHVGQCGLTIAIVIFLSAIHYVSTRWTAHVQNVTSIIKVAFLVGIIVVPFLFGKTDAANLEPVWPAGTDTWKWTGLAAAMMAVLWPYDGWINIGPVTEEIREPQRNVPLALVVGILIVTAVYVAANCVYHLTLPMATVIGSTTVAATTIEQVAGPIAMKIAAFGIMCSAFGAVNSNMMTGPRIYFAMARDRLLPEFIQQVHGKYETPANAVLLQGIWTLLLIVVTFSVSNEPKDAFDDLTNFVIFGGSTFYAMAVGAVFILRRKLPDLPRPYRTWGYPVTPAIYLFAFGAVVISAFVAAPGASLTGLGLIALGIPAFYYLRSLRIENRPAA